MTIEQQKATARSVYEKLKVIDPYCVLAGGAPRDWYFGNECNDLDFYYVSTATTVSACRNQLQKVFKDVEIKTLSEIHGSSSSGVREMSNLYQKMPSLIRVWQCKIAGMEVQFIQLATLGSQFKVIEYMDVSICKIWADVNMNIRLTTAFKKTLASKSMFLSEGYEWGDPHPQKMKQRFEGKFGCASSEDQVNWIILRKALNAIGGEPIALKEEQ